MNKLQNDYDDLKDKIDQGIKICDEALIDCREHIAKGEETLAMFKEY